MEYFFHDCLENKNSFKQNSNLPAISKARAASTKDKNKLHKSTEYDFKAQTSTVSEYLT